jgi:hypothetical protein
MDVSEELAAFIFGVLEYPEDESSTYLSDVGRCHIAR